MAAFAVGAQDFLLDGEPFRVLSGAIHYFRVHPDLWADRSGRGHEGHRPAAAVPFSRATSRQAP